MTHILNVLFIILNDFRCLLLCESISFFLKAVLLVAIVWHSLFNHQAKKLWIYLVTILIAGMFSDISWIVWILHKFFFADYDSRPILFLIRLSWGWAIIEYQALSFLLEGLLEKNYKITNHQKFFLFANSMTCCVYFYIAIFEFNNIKINGSFETTFVKYALGIGFLSIFSSLFYIFLKLKKSPEENTPRLIKKQIKILIQAIVLPHLTSDFIQVYLIQLLGLTITNNYAVVNLSTLFLTLALYFCSHKMLGLRFLNAQKPTYTTIPIKVFDDFKVMLEQLSHATEMNELRHITQTFFRHSFGIQPSRVEFYVRTIDAAHTKNSIPDKQNPTEKRVELFIFHHEALTDEIKKYLYTNKILITDELAFSEFYTTTPLTYELLRFLEQINADIFLPVFEQNTLVGYIVVERNARETAIYTQTECDQMAICASYLANIITLLQTKNLKEQLHKDKELREELFFKHQEINQYKESIRSFLRDSQDRKIGIIFYQQRKFIFGNKASKDLISININAQEGHPLARTMMRLVKHLEAYKTEQTIITKDAAQNRLVLHGIMHLEKNSIIILVYYPEIADIVKKQIDLLKDPSQWDYLLYLETTASGKLINQLLPAQTEHILAYKIHLLKLGLSKKAILLNIPSDDIQQNVELIHKISLREVLHTIVLESQEKNFDTAIKLFGMNSIFTSSPEQPLLVKLHNIGTLFIKNVHFLDLETQNMLAEFIKYGYFRSFKGEKKIMSDVRIICSSTANLAILTHENKFSQLLYNELVETTLSLAPLHALPKNEIKELIETLSDQSLQKQEFKQLLELNDREQSKILESSPVSVTELKKRIDQLLIQKSKKNDIFHEVQFDPAYNLTDPELIEAARLGKKALKNPKTLTTLMLKFKGNQNKIAQFLGVNRSSINRRCKEYNIV